MPKHDQADTNFSSIKRNLDAMKATGHYNDWRAKLSLERAAYDATPRGRTELFWERVTEPFRRFADKIVKSQQQ